MRAALGKGLNLGWGVTLAEAMLKTANSWGWAKHSLQVRKQISPEGESGQYITVSFAELFLWCLLTLDVYRTCFVYFITEGNIYFTDTGVCCFCCLVAKSCLTFCDHMDCSPPGSSVYGISQERIVEWVAISFSRASFQPEIEPQSPALRQILLLLSHQGSPESEC